METWWASEVKPCAHHQWHRALTSYSVCGGVVDVAKEWLTALVQN